MSRWRISQQTGFPQQNGRVKTLEELIYVFTHNANPAVNPLLDLVDDEPLEPTAYKILIASLNSFFAKVAENAGKQGSTVFIRHSARTRRSFSLFAGRSVAIYSR